ncbi:MAG: efflux RND transporter periplasmic adaptor subunit [Ignavibacteriales bacterium]|nr:efflux RND transporter periplasmic adaptor subunit [Ignavibacteriales bacterium]
MKSLKIVLFFLAVFLAAGCSSKSQEETKAAAKETAKEIYTCPMHPSVVSDKPGACPVCGMALVRKTAATEMKKDEMQSLQAVSLSPSQRVLANISVEEVMRRSMSKTIEAVGVIDVAEPLQASVSARFRGRIEKLHVDYTGERVKQGQQLFDLYSPDLISAQQDFLIAATALDNARKTGNSTSEEVQERLLAASRERLSVHFGMRDAQIAELVRSQHIKNALTFLSPIRGTIVQKQVQEGQYVDEGMLLYQVVDLSKLWIYVDVYEKDLRFIHVGQEVHITNQAFPGRTFHGKVTFVDPVVNSETRTARVRTEFDNPDGSLKPNMFVSARIEVSKREALAVPISAVLSTGKRTVVWVEVGQNMFEPRDIRLGISSDSHYEILKGLNEGERVATTGGFLIDSESALQQPSSADPHAGHSAPAKPKEEKEHRH